MPLERGGFGLAAALDLEAPQLSRDVAVELMTQAHEACPYSRATRGNIEVTLTVGGTTIERHARAAERPGRTRRARTRRGSGSRPARSVTTKSADCPAPSLFGLAGTGVGRWR